MPATISCRRCGRTFEAKRMDAMFCLDCRAERAKERAAKYDLHHKEPCPKCSKPMVRRADLCKSCDNKARATRYLGENNPNWQLGRTKTKAGYVRVRVTPNKIASKAYRLEHRVVWEAAHGPIPKGWHVHHLNGITDDNRLENLVALSPKDHHTQHEAYRERIRALERELRELKGE